MLVRRSFSRLGVASDRLQIKRTRAGFEPEPASPFGTSPSSWASTTTWITGWTSWDSGFIRFTTLPFDENCIPNALMIIEGQCGESDKSTMHLAAHRKTLYRI